MVITLSGAGAELGVGHSLLSHAHNLGVLPDLHNEGILRPLKQLYDVLVEWIHVLHQPLVGRIIHFSRVMDDSEISYSPTIAFPTYKYLISDR